MGHASAERPVSSSSKWSCPTRSARQPVMPGAIEIDPVERGSRGNLERANTIILSSDRAERAVEAA